MCPAPSRPRRSRFCFFPPASTETYAVSLHDALPISDLRELDRLTGGPDGARRLCWGEERRRARDRKSTRLNSSHLGSSYAVFCLQNKTRMSLSRALLLTRAKNQTSSLRPSHIWTTKL